MDLGVVWFDAHADFDTAEDNRSGFFDVFALPILAGDAWQALAGALDGLGPAPHEMGPIGLLVTGRNGCRFVVFARSSGASFNRG